MDMSGGNYSARCLGGEAPRANATLGQKPNSPKDSGKGNVFKKKIKLNYNLHTVLRLRNCPNKTKKKTRWEEK
jgi:hypothetical protein